VGKAKNKFQQKRQSLGVTFYIKAKDSNQTEKFCWFQSLVTFAIIININKGGQEIP
jgi:hypothetical protein